MHSDTEECAPHAESMCNGQLKCCVDVDVLEHLRDWNLLHSQRALWSPTSPSVRVEQE